jgi:hypothetical protein
MPAFRKQSTDNPMSTDNKSDNRTITVREPDPWLGQTANQALFFVTLLKLSGSLCSLVHAATHTSQSHHTQIPYYHFTTHTSHAHKPHPLITPPSTAASRHACGRPRRGAVAAVLPHWTHDNGRLPGGRLTRQLPPPANGHGRGALCERRDGTASAQWAPRLPGQPASRLHLQALCVRRLTISIPIGAAFG